MTVWQVKVMQSREEMKTHNYDSNEWQVYEEEYDRKNIGGRKINRDIRQAASKDAGRQTEREARVREKVKGWGAAAEGERSLGKMKHRKEAVVWQGGDLELRQEGYEGVKPVGMIIWCTLVSSSTFNQH